MFTITIILAVLAVVFMWVQIKSDRYDTEWPAWLSVFLFVSAAVFLMLSSHWQISSSTLTGYIYQRQESFGYANYDLRYSMNSGTDSQPTFCVQAGSDQDKKMQELVGSDTKVTVSIPSHGYFVSDNLFQCNSEANLLTEKEK